MVSRVALISCSKTKRGVPAKARDLYQGNLFKKSLQLAELERFPWIFVLSARFGLVELNSILPPYDETLLDKTREEIEKWSIGVVTDLKQRSLGSAELHFFAGRVYYQFLPQGIPRYKGESIGEISHNLQEEIDQLVMRKKGFRI